MNSSEEPGRGTNEAPENEAATLQAQGVESAEGVAESVASSEASPMAGEGAAESVATEAVAESVATEAVAESVASPIGRPTYVFLGVLAAVSLFLDIASKAWAEVTLNRRGFEPIEIIDGHLAVTLAYNQGGA